MPMGAVHSLASECAFHGQSLSCRHVSRSLPSVCTAFVSRLSTLLFFLGYENHGIKSMQKLDSPGLFPGLISPGGLSVDVLCCQRPSLVYRFSFLFFSWISSSLFVFSIICHSQSSRNDCPSTRHPDTLQELPDPCHGASRNENSLVFSMRASAGKSRVSC